jgi:molecular chaperone HscB
VLKHQGFDIGEQRTKDVPPELLEEVFELNMALEESDTSQLASFERRFGQMLAESNGELQQRFAAYDASQSRDELAAIRAILNRRRYIENLIVKIQAAANL